MKFRLSTGYEKEFLYDNGIGDIVAQYETAEEAGMDIDKFTPEALKKFYIVDGDEVVGEYDDLIFVDATVEESEDGYLCHFFLRVPTDIEIRLAALEEQTQTLSKRVDAAESKIEVLDERVFPEIIVELRITPTTVGGFVSLCDINDVEVMPDILEVFPSESQEEYAIQGHIPDGTYFFRGADIVLGRNGEIKVFTVSGSSVNAGTFDVMTLRMEK